MKRKRRYRWKANKRKRLSNLILVALGAVFAFAAYQLISGQLAYKKARDYYSETSRQYVQQTNVQSQTAEDEQLFAGDMIVTAQPQTPAPMEQATAEATDRFGLPLPVSSVRTPTPEPGFRQVVSSRVTAQKPPIAVSFTPLLQSNQDVVGWLYCKGLPINYPVMQARDNDYYLHRKPDHSDSDGGSIFMDAANNPFFADDVTLIYGHNMRDGSMFAKLVNYASQSYYNEHPVMWLMTPEQNYKVELFACISTLAGDWPYTLNFGTAEQKEQYLARAQQDSIIKSPVTPTADDRVLLMSTCHYSYNDERYVVLGVLVPVVEGQV